MGYLQMTRNVESIFGAVVTAPHQIPYTYTATGGEKFISLPFYPVTGIVTINGGMQVPLDNFEIDGNTLNLGCALSKGDVVFCLFDKILSPEDYKTGIRIYKFQATGGETEFTPDYTSYGVQSLYIGGEYKTPEIEYSYDSTTGKVSLQTALTAGVWVVAEMSVKQPNISPLFDRSIQEIARAANVKDSEVILSTDTTQFLNGKKVVYDVAAQKIYGLPTLPSNVYINSVSNGQLTYSPGNITVTLLDPYQQQNIRELWRRSLAEAGLTLVDGSFEAGGTLVNSSDVMLQERTGKVFSGPAGTVAAGTNPASGEFVDVSHFVLRGSASVADFRLATDIDWGNAIVRALESNAAAIEFTPLPGGEKYEHANTITFSKDIKGSGVVRYTGTGDAYFASKKISIAQTQFESAGSDLSLWNITNSVGVTFCDNASVEGGLYNVVVNGPSSQFTFCGGATAKYARADNIKIVQCKRSVIEYDAYIYGAAGWGVNIDSSTAALPDQMHGMVVLGQIWGNKAGGVRCVGRNTSGDKSDWIQHPIIGAI